MAFRDCTVILSAAISFLFVVPSTLGCGGSGGNICTPSDCVISDWSKWSKCSKTCGNSGRKQRSRTIVGCKARVV